MDKLLELIYHSLGICGEGHFDILSFFTKGFLCFQCYIEHAFINVKLFVKYTRNFFNV